MRRPPLLILILLETLTLFCLSVLGDRVANLVHLPNPLLLGFAALGIAITTIISYSRQSPPPENSTHLTVGEIWQRLKPRKRHRMLFGPMMTDKQMGRMMGCSIGLAFGLGIVGIIVRPYFVQRALSPYWYGMLGIFILIAGIPLLKFGGRAIKPTWENRIEDLLGFIAFILIYGLLMVGGMAFGSLLLYTFLRIFKS